LIFFPLPSGKKDLIRNCIISLISTVLSPCDALD
jgi:hypothetical protein